MTENNRILRFNFVNVYFQKPPRKAEAEDGEGYLCFLTMCIGYLLNRCRKLGVDLFHVIQCSRQWLNYA